MKPWQQWLTLALSWWRDNPGARRWAIVAVVVTALLALILNGSLGRSPQVSLFDARELTNDEISLMQVAFGQSGLNDYEVNGSTIRVPRTQRGEYLKALAEHNTIPADLVAQQRTPSSFDFFQSRSQQRQQLLERKKQIIRDMVLQLGFVHKAIIEYDEARGSSPFADLQRTAIVTVRPVEDRTLETAEVQAIRDTVRGAVAGLRSNDITVIDTNANRSHTLAEHELGEATPPHVAAKLLEERKYEQKIRSALAAYPDVRVNVEVAVDPVVRRVVDHRDIQSEPRVFSQTSQLETSGRMPRIGQPSTEVVTETFSTGANGQAQLDPANTDEPWQRRIETTTTMANGTFETTETVGPRVTCVNVSIGIPEQYVRYFVTRTLASDNAATVDQPTIDQVFQQIRSDVLQKVQPLVPLPELTAAASSTEPQHIVVMMDHEVPASAEMFPPSRVASTWWGRLWTTLRWPLLGLIVVTVAASALRRPIGRSRHHGLADRSAEPIGGGSIQLEDFDSPPATPVIPEADLAYEHNQEAVQENIRLQLDQWCRENPDAAAATIRQWLEKAG
ncbi:MAG: hypothetical protein ACR2NP_11970 [Pirellulaceae bacterium]